MSVDVLKTLGVIFLVAMLLMVTLDMVYHYSNGRSIHFDESVLEPVWPID
jgi:hypothetical protein